LPWIGDRAARIAIAALTAYALLPIVRNTYTGIEGVDPTVLEVAKALGMTSGQRLRKVELPLAAGFILAGLRTATVLAVGAPDQPSDRPPPNRSVRKSAVLRSGGD